MGRPRRGAKTFRLGIVEFQGEYGIGWFGGDLDDPAEGELCLGERTQDADHEAATAAVKGEADEQRGGRLTWYSEAGARRALVRARAAVRDVISGRAAEPWEAPALAAGWKPPRGWGK